MCLNKSPKSSIMYMICYTSSITITISQERPVSKSQIVSKISNNNHIEIPHITFVITHTTTKKTHNKTTTFIFTGRSRLFMRPL